MAKSFEEFNDVNLVAKVYAHVNGEYIDEYTAYIHFYNWLLGNFTLHDPSYWIEMFVHEELGMSAEEFFKYVEDNGIEYRR